MESPGIPLHRWTVIAAVAVLLILVGLASLLSAPARGASFTLYGSAGQGWGLTPTTIASPGPTLVVTQGERVDLLLFAADGATHTWCIDYNGDNACSVGENESGQFSSSTVAMPFTFWPTGAPGVYNYVCGIHGGFIMHGPIRINPAVNPTVSIASPSGSQRWTGGSAHAVVWNMNDPNDPITSLRAWVNYTTGGPWVPIAGPITGTSNPHSTLWTLPAVDVGAATVNVTVVDPAGNRVWATRPVPVIDSTAPTIATTVPGNGDLGVPTTASVVITFSEAMNRSSTAKPSTVALQDTRTPFPWIPVAYSWSSGDTVLTATPLAALDPSATYRASVNASATDASDPGNPMAAPMAWVFTTATGADLVKPQIQGVAASPSPAEFGNSVDITALITDNDRVSAAYASVTLPDNSPFNGSMSLFSGDTWILSQGYPLLGNYVFHVEAVDPSGNWNRSTASGFVVRDTTRPALSGVAVAPSPAEVYQPALVSVSASDPFLVGVSLAIESGNLSMAFNPTTSKWEKSFVPVQEKTYTFTIWAVDSSGNPASLAGSVVAQDTTAPPMPMGVVAAYVAGIGIEARWSSVAAPDLAGYRLYRSTSPTGPFTAQVGPPLINGTAYIDRDVAAGTTYYYVVTAEDLGGRESAQSPVAFATVPGGGVDNTALILAGLLVVVVAVAAGLVLLLWLRRRRSA